VRNRADPELLLALDRLDEAVACCLATAKILTTRQHLTSDETIDLRNALKRVTKPKVIVLAREGPDAIGSRVRQFNALTALFKRRVTQQSGEPATGLPSEDLVPDTVAKCTVARSVGDSAVQGMEDSSDHCDVLFGAPAKSRWGEKARTALQPQPGALIGFRRPDSADEVSKVKALLIAPVLNGEMTPPQASAYWKAEFTRVLTAPGCPGLPGIARSYCHKYRNISARTMQRWIEQIQDEDQISSRLGLPSPVLHQALRHQYPDERRGPKDPELERRVRNLFRDRPGQTSATIAREVYGLGATSAEIRRVQRIAQNIPDSERARAIGGPAWPDLLRSRLLRQVPYPNRVWQMDHFFVQYELVGDGPAVPLFPEEFEAFSQMEFAVRRVWPSGLVEFRRVESLCLTVIQDMCTRCVLAVRVWDRPPSTRTTLLALRDAIERYGLPEVVYTDNGSDLKNGLIFAVLNAVGIYHAHSEPYRPQGRGQIERVGRTIKEMILPHLPGYRGGIHPRAWADEDLLTLEELESLLADRVEVYFNRRVHRTTRRCPREHYESEIHARQLRGLSHVEVTPEVWLPLLAIQDDAVLQNSGIELNGRHYSSPSFVEALNGRRVRIYFDEYRPDIIYVALSNPRGEYRFFAVAERTDNPACPPPTAWELRRQEKQWLEAREAENAEREHRRQVKERLQVARLDGEERGQALAEAVFPDDHSLPAQAALLALPPGPSRPSMVPASNAGNSDDPSRTLESSPQAVSQTPHEVALQQVDSLEEYLRLSRSPNNGVDPGAGNQNSAVDHATEG
jgi:transposase InsO family protein